MRCPMTHDKLLKYINDYVTFVELNDMPATAKVIKSLSAVVELHKPIKVTDKVIGFVGNIETNDYCAQCVYIQNETYPCSTIQAITRNLNS